jgi:hypothetical protein
MDEGESTSKPQSPLSPGDEKRWHIVFANTFSPISLSNSFQKASTLGSMDIP